MLKKHSFWKHLCLLDGILLQIIRANFINIYGWVIRACVKMAIHHVWTPWSTYDFALHDLETICFPCCFWRLNRIIPTHDESQVKNNLHLFLKAIRPYCNPDRTLNGRHTGGHLSKASETFRARKAIFIKQRAVYTQNVSVHIKNMWIKQHCNEKVWDFASAFRVENFSGPLRNGPLKDGLIF